MDITNTDEFLCELNEICTTSKTAAPKTPPPTPIPSNILMPALPVFRAADFLPKAEETRTEWSNSMLKPASRFSLSKRRECKSTSDETFVHELRINGERDESRLLVSNEANSLGSQLWAKKINNGQFGFNPVKLKANATKRVGKNEARFASKLTHANKELTGKKGLKRLSTNGGHMRFGLESKKHNGYQQNKKLFNAVSNSDLNSVGELLDSNMYDVNCADDKQRTCLHIASAKGNVDIIRLLLDYGANPNIRDCVNNLPIHLAIISSHVPAVTVLLEAGTDIHSLDLNGKTVLHLAGTRLRWLLNDENHQASPQLKKEAIMIMNMIKEYLRRKQTTSVDLDMLANRLENVINLDDINSLTIELLTQFDSLNLKTHSSHQV